MSISFFRLTAFITKAFQQAVFSDWENLFYIDPNVITQAVRWLLKHQTPEGAFVEVSRRHLNTRFDSKVIDTPHLTLLLLFVLESQ